MKVKSTFPARSAQAALLWPIVDAICRGSVLLMMPVCAKLVFNKPVIWWMSAKYRGGDAMFRALSLVFPLCSLILAGSLNAASICDAEVIAALKNIDKSHIEETLEDKMYFSFCQREKSEGLTLFIGSDSGQLINNTSLTEACLTGNKSFFWNTTGDFLVSTLSESVQQQLIYACKPDGVLLTGFDDGSTVSVNARYQKMSDGLVKVEPIKVKEFFVSTGDGKPVNCRGSLANKDTSISSDGVSTSCSRNGNQSSLTIQVDMIDANTREISETITFGGTKLLEMKWTAPSVRGTDGHEFHCSSNGGAYAPAGNFNCRNVPDGCGSSAPRVRYCAVRYGTHFELHPAGDLSRLWIDSYRSHKDPKADCDDPSTDAKLDRCVTRRVAVKAAANIKSRDTYVAQ